MKSDRIVSAVLAILLLAGCAREPRRWAKPGLTQPEFEQDVKACGGSTTGSGGYFLFGPLIVLAPLTVIVEGVGAAQRASVKSCMEAKGYRLIEPPASTTSDPIDQSRQR